MSQYYIFDIKKSTRDFKCVSCDLANSPKLQKARSLPVRCAEAGEEIQCDLLSLIPASHEGVTYSYVLVCVDVASSYVFTAPLRSKKSDHVCDALFRIFHSNCYFPLLCSFDEGGEFTSLALAARLQRENINIAWKNYYEKNSNMSESSISRLNSLLRRSLDDSKQWVRFLQTATYSLNAALRRYHTGPDGIQSPCFMLNHREAIVTPSSDVNDLSASEIVKNINKERFLDCNSTLQAIDNRKTHKQNALVLVHREHVLACRKIGNSSRKYKLRSFWELARVIRTIDDQMLLLRLKTGVVRKVHRKITRPVGNDLYKEYSAIYDSCVN